MKLEEQWDVWAQENCPVPVAKTRSPFQEAKVAYDEVDLRLGDEAENDSFVAKAMWLEIAIRLARMGWTIDEFEGTRWPLQGTAKVLVLVRKGL